jgi:hypothetical protein
MFSPGPERAHRRWALASLVTIAAAGCSLVLDSSPKDAGDASDDGFREDLSSEEGAADTDARETDTHEADAAQDDLVPHDGDEEEHCAPQDNNGDTVPDNPDTECFLGAGPEACDVFYPGCPTSGSRTCQENCRWSACELPPGTQDSCDDVLDNDCDSGVNEGCTTLANPFLDFQASPPFHANQDLSIVTAHSSGLICVVIRVTDPCGSVNTIGTSGNFGCSGGTCWNFPTIRLGPYSGLYTFEFMDQLCTSACDCALRDVIATVIQVDGGIECT